MTTTITPKFMAYQDWLKANPDIQEEIETTSKECSECSGKGRRACFECGHVGDCKDCKGTGRFKIETNLTREQYLNQLKRDEAMLERYVAWVKQ